MTPFCNVFPEQRRSHVPLTRSPVNLRVAAAVAAVVAVVLFAVASSSFVPNKAARRAREWADSRAGVHICAHLFIAAEQGVPVGLMPGIYFDLVWQKQPHIYLGLFVSEVLPCKRFPPPSRRAGVPQCLLGARTSNKRLFQNERDATTIAGFGC